MKTKEIPNTTIDDKQKISPKEQRESLQKAIEAREKYSNDPDFLNQVYVCKELCQALIVSFSHNETKAKEYKNIEKELEKMAERAVTTERNEDDGGSLFKPHEVDEKIASKIESGRFGSHNLIG